MRIAVNTQHLLKNKLEGIGWFAHETLSRMVKNNPQHEFLFMFDRPWSSEFIYGSNVTPVRTFLPSRHPVLWYVHYQIDLPVLMRYFKPDVFLSPDGWMPLNLKIPTVDVIHDLNFVHRPTDFPLMYRKYFNHFFPKFARKATRLVTVSEFSKNDIVTQYGIEPGKIDVAYNGCNPDYSPVTPDIKKEIQKRFSGGFPYFINVGSHNPRKNIDGLLQAFEHFKKATNSPFKLVLVGKPMWEHYGANHHVTNMEFRDDVVFTGRVSSEVLHLLTASAEALALVSFSEGFGIPVVEAFYCDVPVLCSNTTSLPEVAGDAALLVDPYNVDSIAQGMAEVAYNLGLRKNLIKAGAVQREKFSWDKTAEVVWKSINKAME